MGSRKLKGLKKKVTNNLLFTERLIAFSKGEHKNKALGEPVTHK